MFVHKSCAHRICDDPHMRLYVCYGTFPAPWRPGGHPCRNAYTALKAAGHDPQLVRVFGLGVLPRFMNPPGRREVERLSGNPWVPTLVLDDGTVIDGSRSIEGWAAANPVARAAEASSAGES
jgi:hypothetical protein